MKLYLMMLLTNPTLENTYQKSCMMVHLNDEIQQHKHKLIIKSLFQLAQPHELTQILKQRFQEHPACMVVPSISYIHHL